MKETVEPLRFSAKPKEATVRHLAFSKGDLLLQMPPATINELVGKNKGLPYEVSPGRVMKDRTVVSVAKKRGNRCVSVRSKNLQISRLESPLVGRVATNLSSSG